MKNMIERCERQTFMYDNVNYTIKYHHIMWSIMALCVDDLKFSEKWSSFR